MAFQPAPNIALVELLYRLDQQTVQNTLHVFRGTGWDAASLSNLAALMASWTEDELMPLLSLSLQFTEVVCTDLATQVSPQVSFAPAVPVIGGNISPAMPNNVAYCMTLLTDFRGRSARGRFYVPGIPGAVVDDSSVSQPFAAALTAAFAVLLPQLNGIGAALCICSRQENNVLRPVASAFQVTSVIARDPVVDSQRRRLPGRGR